MRARGRQRSVRVPTRRARARRLIRRHQTCHFRKHATSAPAELNVSRDRARTQVLLQAEVARLRKWHVVFLWSGWNFPSWCSGGRRPLIAGCLSLQRLGIDVPVTRPAWDLNLRPPASESHS